MNDIDTIVDGPRWVSQAELAQVLGVSRWTVSRARKAGMLRFIELVPGLVRYDAMQVEELIESRHQ